MGQQNIFEYLLFYLGAQPVTLGQLLATLLSLALLAALGAMVLGRWLPAFFDAEQTEPPQRRRIRRLIVVCLLLLAASAVMVGLGVNPDLYQANNFTVKLSTLVQALALLQLARLLDWIFSELLLKRYVQRRAEQPTGHIYRDNSRKASGQGISSRVVQPVVYTLAAALILSNLELDYTLLNTPHITLQSILWAVLIVLFFRLLIWVVVNLFLYRYYHRHDVNIGSQFAINRLFTYFFSVIGVVVMLEYLDVNLTVLWGGAAALLVGVGLGLQQTFNDLICGIILLFERTIEVGDVVDINGLVGIVKRIGIRTSLVETRENISVIVPNSRLVGENVINWSHYDLKARFSVDVGVAYGSDTALVRTILQEIAEAHPKVMRQPEPFVRFSNFGDSSLDFSIFFWTEQGFIVEMIKSDLRFEIDRRFREQGVVIPFPQRDVWIRRAADDNAD